MIQPLIRGFGRPIVEAALQSARENVTISHLHMEETLRTTVTNVINDYLSVVSAEKTLEIDQNDLTRSKKSVEQTKLFIKAGRKAGVELVTVEAAVANTQAKIENDQNAWHKPIRNYCKPLVWIPAQMSCLPIFLCQN